MFETIYKFYFGLMPVHLTEKDLVFGSDYRKFELGTEFKIYDNEYKMPIQKFEGKHVIPLSNIESSEFRPARFLTSPKIKIKLEKKGILVLSDITSKCPEELEKLNSLINEFLENKEQRIQMIQNKERQLAEIEEKKKKEKLEYENRMNSLYKDMMNDKNYQEICVSKLLRTDEDEYTKDVKIYYSEVHKCIIFEKDFHKPFLEYIHSHKNPIDERFIKLNINSIDCLYRDRADYFDRGLYELLNEYALQRAMLNAQSSLINPPCTLKDFSKKNEEKINVSGFIIGGLIGGTAGAILGGMPNYKKDDKESFESIPQKIYKGIELDCISKDLPQLVIRYRINNEYKFLIFDDNHFAINKDFLNEIISDKFVDAYTGERYYLLQKSENKNVDIYEEVKKLKELYDMGIITKEEFEIKKKKLLKL